MKLLKTKICVKKLTLLLLLRENQTFSISFIILQRGTAWVKILAMLQRLPHVDVSKPVY